MSLKRDVLEQLGASAYIDKPLDFDAFVQELVQHIDTPRPPAAVPVTL